MARRYTSDRPSSKRLASPGGATSSIIPEVNLEASIDNTPFRTGNTYFKSQPLNIPGPVQIPDAPIAPDVSQNTQALADWAGQINKDIDTTTKEFWNWNKIMDEVARKKAEAAVAKGEKKEDLIASQKNLNRAKNKLEKDAETNPASAHSWSVFHGLDRRTEREYDVVVAKNELMTVLQGLPSQMKELWKESTLLDDGKGVLRPYSLPNEEDIFGQRAMEIINNSINNGQALVESKSQIQAAIYSARQQVSTEHNSWLDGRADTTYKKKVSTLIQNSLNDNPLDDLGFIDPKDSTKSTAGLAGTRTVNEFVNGSASNKNYQELKKNLLGIWVNSAITHIPANRFEAEIPNIKNELLHTKIGPNTFLWEQYGSKEALLEAFDLAIDSARNAKSQVVDKAAKDRGEKNGRNTFEGLLENHNDFDMETPGIQSKTIVLPGGETVVTQITNLEYIRDEKNKLYMEALRTMEPGEERTAYLNELDESYKLYMAGYGKVQQEENYNWLYEQIGTTDKPIYWIAQIKEMERNGLITSEHSNDLINNESYGIGTEARSRRENFNTGNKKALTELRNSLEGYYKNKGDENTTTTDEKVLIEQKISEVNNELLKLLRDPGKDFPTKQKEALELINKAKDNINKANSEIIAAKRGVDTKDESKQEGSNQKVNLTINEGGRVNNAGGGATNDFVGTTPQSIVKVLSGKRNKQENLALSNSITRAPLYSKTIFKSQLLALEQAFETREKEGITEPLTWESLIEINKFNNLRLFAQRRNEGKVPAVKSKLPLRFDALFGSKRPQGEEQKSYSEATDIDLRSTGIILDKINEHTTPKEYFINQMNVHGIEVNDDMMEMLNSLWPEEKTSSILDRGTLVAGTNLKGILPSPKKELETNMLNILHSGESTVDTKHGGYEAFNQGGTDKGKTVLGFSGTYGDHPANKGKKLTEMTIQEILDIQDSGYNFDIYPKGKAGTKKWQDSGGIHAAGRYQLLRGAIRDAMRFTGIEPTEKFTPEIQDRLGLAYLLQFGPSRWTSMEKKENIKLRKELDKLLEQYKKPEKTESSTIDSKSDIA
jgi:hypothetical protein